jgi:hypothetical protein
MQPATAGTAAPLHGDPGRAATDAEPVRRAAVVIHAAKHDDIDGVRATVDKAMADRGWAEGSPWSRAACWFAFGQR